jgi:hypothetical protein
LQSDFDGSSATFSSNKRIILDPISFAQLGIRYMTKYDLDSVRLTSAAKQKIAIQLVGRKLEPPTLIRHYPMFSSVRSVSRVMCKISIDISFNFQALSSDTSKRLTTINTNTTNVVFWSAHTPSFFVHVLYRTDCWWTYMNVAVPPDWHDITPQTHEITMTSIVERQQCSQFMRTEEAFSGITIPPHLKPPSQVVVRHEPSQSRL